MATRSKFRHEDVARIRRGYKVRTISHPSGHKVRVAFPPGPRHTGSGQIVSILHPQTEANPCVKNPLQELVKDSKGHEWFVNVLGSEAHGYTAEGFPVTGKKLKRVGRPVVAKGKSEAEANDALIAKMEKNPKGGSRKSEVGSRKKKAKAKKGGRQSAVGSRQKNKARKANAKTRAPKARKRRRNLDEVPGATRVYEQFAGKKSTGMVDVQEPDDRRDDFAHLGFLVEAIFLPRILNEGQTVDLKKIRALREFDKQGEPNHKWAEIARQLSVTLVELNFSADKVRVTSNAEGSQIYFIGGKQNLDSVLDKFGEDTSKDNVELGELIALTYFARKWQDRFQAVNYEHILGEEGGAAPIAFYDRLQKRIKLAGGTYTIEKPGIIN